MADKFKPCSIPDCNGNAHWTFKGSRGMCRHHYRRVLWHGDPFGGRAPNGEAERFYREVVIPCTQDDCLIWPYATNAGYAVMNVGGRAKAIHRMACVEVHGEPPTPDHEAAHSCGQGSNGCVNPTHLRWATTVENQADKVIHGTTNRGERCGSAKLTEDQVRAIRCLKGKMTQREIGDMYGVNFITIGDIHNLRTWFWLE